MVSGRELFALMAPLWFLVEGCSRKVSHRLDDRAGRGTYGRRNLPAGRLIHEGHELVREARHRATDANSADVWATADSAHPAAFGDVALDDGAPTSELDQTGRRVVLGCKLSLLVVSGAVASFVHGVAE